MMSGRVAWGRPKKLRGCIAASPIESLKFILRNYLFFFLAFFAAILFSSRLILDLPPAMLAERVFNPNV